MFCKKCGSSINKGDLFCSECGCKVESASNVKENPRRDNSEGKSNTYKVEVKIPEFKIEGCQILKIAKLYFLKPLSFFDEFISSNNGITAAAMTIVLPLLYGIMAILYTSSLLNAFFSGIKKLPEYFAKAGLISFEEAIEAKTNMIKSNDFIVFKESLKNMIDYKKIFFNNFIDILGIILLTFIIILLISMVIMKSRIKPVDIFFVSSCAYIPLLLSVGVSALVSFVNILAGLFIILFGYVLSFITLYSGIKKFSDEKKDKVFVVMVILFFIISIVLSIVITKKVEISILEIRNMFNSISNFL